MLQQLILCGKYYVLYEIGKHENNHLEHAIACHAENSWPMFNANISLKVFI